MWTRNAFRDIPVMDEVLNAARNVDINDNPESRSYLTS